MTQLIKPYKIPHTIPSSMVPAHKILSNSDPIITMDAFSYGIIKGCSLYFLSHFHSDHYYGLSKTFKGTIVCTTVTRNLVVSILNVPYNNIIAVPFNKWTTVDAGGGVVIECLCLDAFHCPGSAIFFILLKDKTTILHTGDFRAGKEVLSNPLFLENITNLSKVYIDSTYSSQKYTFPSQKMILDQLKDFIWKLNVKDKKGCICPIRRLYLIGTYLIGKEKIARTVAEVVDAKIFCEKRKNLVIRAMEDEGFLSKITSDPLDGQVHLVGMGDLTSENVNALLNRYWPKYTHCTIIKGTGWTHASTTCSTPSFTDHFLINRGQKIRRKGCVMRMSIPYSEHSSYLELIDFINTIIQESKNTELPSLIMTVDNCKDIGFTSKKCFPTTMMMGEEYLKIWHKYKG